MSKSDKKCCSKQENCIYKNCGVWSLLGTFCMIISAIIICLIAIEMTQSYELKSCKVLDVYVPKVCPSHNKDNWSRCKCGRKCKSYNPCENLVVVINNNSNFYDLKEYQMSKSDPCTFYDKICKFEHYESKIAVANDTYNKYINTTIDCYYNSRKDFVFIDFDYTNNYLILISFSLGFMFCCVCVLCILQN